MSAITPFSARVKHNHRTLTPHRRGPQFGAGKPPEVPEKKGLFHRWKLKLGLLLAGLTTAYTGVGYTTTFVRLHGNGRTFETNPNVRIHYYVPKGFGHWLGSRPVEFEEANVDLTLPWVKHAMAKRFAEVLQKRPDLLKAIMEFPNGMDIQLFKADSLERHGDMETLGVVSWNEERQSLVMRLSTGGISRSDGDYNDGIDVTAHELTHVLDNIEIIDGKTIIVGTDGYLPGWNDADKRRWSEAREIEMAKISQRRSPMNPYALTNEHEFLAVAVETFFERGDDLERSNPVLYSMLSDFFKLNPADSLPVAVGRNILKGNVAMEYIRGRDAQPFTYLIAGFGIVMVGGGWVLIAKRRKQRAEANPVQHALNGLDKEMKALQNKLKKF